MYIASFLKLDRHVELLHFYFFFFLSLTETQISCFEFINRWKSYFISFEACARPHKMKSSIPPKYQLCVLGPGRRGCRLEGQLQPHTSLVPVSGGPDGEVWILVVQSTSALSPDWQGRRSNEISRHIEVVKSKPKRRRCPVVVWMTSCTNSWSLANIWKNVDQQSVWELHSGWSPSQNILLLTMWQLERLGSGCSPPRLLLLVYTYLCAVGGEFPFSECCFWFAESCSFCRGAEILPAAAAASHPVSGFNSVSETSTAAAFSLGHWQNGFHEHGPASVTWRMGKDAANYGSQCTEWSSYRL